MSLQRAMTLAANVAPQRAATPRSTLRLAAWASLLTLFAAPYPALAQTSYPNRTVRIINPFAPGGNTDIVGRLLANHLSAAWGQSVIMENRPGGGATTGTDMAAKSSPDGYTLLIATSAATSIAPSLYKSLPYDAQKDFIAIYGLNISYSGLGITPTLPVKTMKELVDYARAHSGKMSFSSPGTGATSQIALEYFGQVHGMNMVHVPYRGSAPSLMAVMAGDVQLTLDPLSTLGPQVQDGKIRGIAVAGPKRTPLIPDMPTTTEAGYPDLQAAAWTGLMVPAGTPPEIVEKIESSVATLMHSADFNARLAATASEGLDLAGPKFAAFIKEETERWGVMAKKLGTKLD